MVDRVSTAFEKLTPREREILRLIAAHLQSKEIARALGLSPKTVEMHVLSARRRLSGMSRRDAALAFVAWEGCDPGSDYRKQSEPLAAPSDTQPSDREIGNGDEPTAPEQTIQTAMPAIGPAQRPSQWRAALKELVAGSDRPGAHLERPAAQRNWRHEMSALQWLGLILAIAAAMAVFLAVTSVSLHVYLRSVDRILPR